MIGAAILLIFKAFAWSLKVVLAVPYFAIGSVVVCFAYVFEFLPSKIKNKLGKTHSPLKRTDDLKNIMRDTKDQLEIVLDLDHTLIQADSTAPKEG